MNKLVNTSFGVLILCLLNLLSCNLNNKKKENSIEKKTTTINKSKTYEVSCSFDTSFDSLLFYQYYQKDTSQFKMDSETHIFTTWTDTQLSETLFFDRQDGFITPYNYEKMLGYALKKGLPDAYAYKVQYEDCNSRKMQLYLLRAVRLKSSVGINQLSRRLKFTNSYKESILFDSTYSSQGYKECSYNLYILYAQGKFEKSSRYVYKENIDVAKADFYYQRALKQKHPEVMYQEALKILPDNKPQSLQYLTEVLDVLANEKSGLSALHMEVLEQLKVHFPKEWEKCMRGKR